MRINKKIIAVVVMVLVLAMTVMPIGGQIASADTNKVYVGGCPIGLELQIDGVMIIGQANTLTENGSASLSANVENGDIIQTANGVAVKTVKDLQNAVKNADEKMLLQLGRGDDVIHTYIEVKREIPTNEKKIGLIVKDIIQGVGTLTFIRDDNTFGALGHPASIGKSKNVTRVKGGDTTNCLIIGVNKGQKGKCGELKGVFVNDEKMKGNVTTHNKFGVFGELEKGYVNPLYANPLEVASIGEVKIGKATILSTVDGKIPKEYDIEIIQKNNQTSPQDRGMVIRIVDEELLEKTGGIVQGMSGSPIIQNGKFVGAVTHVFVNDPTRGFGLFGAFMVQN